MMILRIARLELLVTFRGRRFRFDEPIRVAKRKRPAE